MSESRGRGSDLVRTTAYRSVTGAWSEPVALACSGGVDSTALLLLAGEALRRRKVAPFVVMHVDHRTRPHSGDDADVVRRLCADQGVPFVSLVVAQSGTIAGRSAEDIWRERRYAALSQACDRLGVGTLVTAHTRDDQVETVLMRVFSGSVAAGMARETQLDARFGSIRLLRPLLDVPREDLDEVLTEAGVTPLIDPSNVDTSFRRNAVRHQVVPTLREVFPGFERALLRSVHLNELDSRYCDQQAVGVYTNARRIIPDGIALKRQVVRDADAAIASRVVRLAALAVISTDDTRELTFERIDAVVFASKGRSGAVIELPYGVQARIERDEILFIDTKGGRG